MKDSSGKKRSGIAAAFWIAVVLAIVIAFLVKQDHIIGVLKETAFFEHVFGYEPEFIARHETPATENKAEAEKSESIVLGKTRSEEKTPTENSAVLASEVSSSSDTQTVSPAAPEREVAKPVQVQKESESAGKPASGGTSVAQNNGTSTGAAVQNTKTVAPSSNAKMNQYLCFIAISGDGFVERKEVNRAVSKTNTPLTAALTALLEGPGIPELEKGYISLIPDGTKLLSASVQNRTALINFSQEFAFNKYGAPGYLGQLMQIVYTATAFDTIDNVQFLIEGQKNEYLGGEGVWIGTPLARYNFK